MPELPEVETVKRTLETNIIGKRITRVNVFLPKLVLPLGVDEFKDNVEGSNISSLARRGKYLLIHLSSSFTLVISLRMTGRLVFVPPGEEIVEDKHTHLIFDFQDGGHLLFNDIRKFGTMHCIPMDCVETCPEIAKLGPEPLGSDFSEECIRERLKKTSRNIKQVLLDQTVIAGLGNIYADESLFAAGIHPETAANKLSDKQIHNLYLAIENVLSEAVLQKGTTIRDYVDGSGKSGNYQWFLKVYGRKGKKCYSCDHEIQTVKLGGRTSSFCPGCQQEDG